MKFKTVATSLCEARLQEGLADLKAGRILGPFEDADDLITHLHRTTLSRVCDEGVESSK